MEIGKKIHPKMFVELLYVTVRPVLARGVIKRN